MPHDRDRVRLLTMLFPPATCEHQRPSFFKRSPSRAQRRVCDTPENPKELSCWASELLFPIWISAPAAIWQWAEDGPPSWALHSLGRVALRPTSSRLSLLSHSKPPAWRLKDQRQMHVAKLSLSCHFIQHFIMKSTLICCRRLLSLVIGDRWRPPDVRVVPSSAQFKLMEIFCTDFPIKPSQVALV